MAFAIQFLLPLAGGLLTGLAALAAILWLGPKRRDRSMLDTDLLAEPRWFRFRHGYLLEHSGNVGFLLPAPINHLRAWDTLVEGLSDVANGVPEAFAALRDAGRPFKLEGAFGRDRIVILGLRDGEEARVSVSTADARQETVRIDMPTLARMEGEIAMLARAGDGSPTLGWAVDGDGRVVWSNRGYSDVTRDVVGPDAAQGWPLHVLFPEGAGARPGTMRRKLTGRDGAEHWFDVTTTAPGPDGLRHMYAQDLDAVIRAEESLRSFIQTLTRSFAFLPTGLAIFDREGELVLFNPTLLDTTGLDPTWLSRRPRMTDFFDALRERQRLPEPRDYKAWRDGLARMDGTDASGTHVETWTLADGTTYRMTGQPQGDGSVTLLLEDVSAEMRANRSRRIEADVLGDLVDRLDEAIVVFERDGRTILANDGARGLWFAEGETASLPGTIEGCIAFWKTLSRPSPVWSDLRDALRAPDAERAEWSETLQLVDGRELLLRITPLPRGRVSLGFLPAAVIDLPQDVAAGGRPLRAVRA